MESVSTVLLLAIMAAFPALTTSMQTEGTTEGTTSSSPLISYNVAFYIMIGIIAAYSFLTLICCILVVLTCRYGRKVKRRETSSTPYRGLHKLQPRLATIVEESESRASSQTSFFKGQKKEVSPNLEDESPTVETSLDELLKPEGWTLTFTNKTAFEREDSKSDSSSDEKTGSFGRVVVASNINRNGDRAKKAKPYDSPLLHYSPRGSSIPPEEVKVPFTEDEDKPQKEIIKLDHTGSPRYRKPNVSTENQPSSGSPFSKRKHPGKEIPSSSNLTDYRRKTSTDGRQQASNRVHPEDDDSSRARVASFPAAAVAGVKLPPLVRSSPKTKRKTNSVGVAAEGADIISGSGSPIRSRPIPKHPVRSSPSHSPFLKRAGQDEKTTGSGSPVRSRPIPRHPVRPSPSHSPFLSRGQGAKDVTSTLATVQTAAEGKTATSRSSSTSTGSGGSSSILTVDTLVKRLQPVKKKWYIIGINLKVSKRRLNVINAEQRNSPDKCLAAMCEEWVESAAQEATWQKIVEALRSELVAERELAATLEEQYCWAGSNSKTWL